MTYENEVRLRGYLGEDAEEFSEGCLKFRIATTDGKKQDGNKNVNWHSVKAFGKTVEYCDPLFKGDLVQVKGRIQYNEHNGKWYTEIIAFDIVNVSRNNYGKGNGNNGSQKRAQEEKQKRFNPPSREDDDLPF